MKKILAVIPARAGSKGIPNKALPLTSKTGFFFFSTSQFLVSTQFRSGLLDGPCQDGNIVYQSWRHEVR